jgi:fermentation-respiration switch protein FrsA (DUF1100 family)
MRIALRNLAIAAFLSSLAAPAAGGPVQDRIYRPPAAPLVLAGLPSGTVLIEVRTADGVSLTGLAKPARDGMPTLLVLHGNGSSAADSVAWLGPLFDRGYGIVAAEYRGYSGNPGKPSEAGLAADADAFLAFARVQAGTGPIWVVGHSLGGGVAFGLAGRQRLDALVTVGVFTRLRAMAPKLARAFVPNGYDNKAAVPLLDEPYFLVHGSSDATVPLAQGEELHSAAGAAHRQGASFVVMGADHKPSGEQMLAILTAAAAALASGSYSADMLPAEIKLIPFGRQAPINP